MRNKKETNAGLKIIPGMCCAIDVDNDCKLRESECTHVVVLRLVKKKLFRKSIWEVKDLDDLSENPQRLQLEEWRLYPENMSVIRYPDDMPVINDKDMETINMLIECLSSNHNIAQLICYDSDKKREDMHKRLKALKIKLEYYTSMKEV